MIDEISKTIVIISMTGIYAGRDKIQKFEVIALPRASLWLQTKIPSANTGKISSHLLL